MFKTLDPKLTIKELKLLYSADRFQFEFNCSMYLAGDAKKQLRQEIVKELTGKIKPIKECGLHLVSDLLKAHFEQPLLFDIDNSLEHVDYKEELNLLHMLTNKK